MIMFKSVLSNIFVLSIAMCFSLSCVTLNDDNEGKPPKITLEMPLEEAVGIAVNHGGATLKTAKKRFVKKREWIEVGKIVQKDLLSGVEHIEEKKLLNYVHLYMSAKPRTGIPVFLELLKDERILARQLAWHIAAAFPSKKMRAQIDFEVSNLLTKGDLTEHFNEEFAFALKNNLIKEHYTVARQGLNNTNLAAFVETMIRLNPKRASVDLLEYLAKAPIEELRQLHMKTVNVFAAMQSLKHLIEHPAPSTHPKISHLFFYAISRNLALADLAREALSGYLVKDKEYLAMILSKQPAWIQLAFVEGASRNMSRNLEVFLSELKLVTAQKSVVEEINAIRR